MDNLELVKPPQGLLDKALGKTEGKEGKEGSEGNEGGGNEGNEGKEGKEGKQNQGVFFNSFFKSEGKEGDEGGGGNEGSEGNEGGNEGNELGELNSPIKVLLNNYGYTSKEALEKFKDIDFEDSSIENIEKFNSIRDTIYKDEVLNQFFEEAPPVKSLYDHLAAGKSVETWLEKEKAIDWAKIEVKQDDIEGQEQVIRMELKAKGITGKKADLIVNGLKDADELFEASKESLDNLAKADKARLAKMEKDENDRIENDRKAAKQTIDKIDEMISKQGKIGNVVIPAEIRKTFKETILNAKAREEMYEKAPLELNLLADLIIFTQGKGLKGLDVSKTPDTKKIKVEVGNRKTLPASGQNKSDGLALKDLKNKVHLENFYLQD